MTLCLLSLCALVLSIPFKVNAAHSLTTRDSIVEPNPGPSIFEYLQQDEILEMTIATDIQKFIERKYTDKDQKAMISMKNADGFQESMEIKIAPRGKFRRQKCDLPPIKLNFSKKKLKEKGIREDFDKLKLVTHCLDTEASAQEVLREYWAYKLYNQMTDYSFQVQLVRLECVDTENPDSTSIKFAFLIEDDDQLAERLQGKIVEAYNFDYKKFNKEVCHNFLLFQYMIGNTEWSIENQRNIKIIQPNDGSKPFVIPYDFDFSALVNASYALPNPDYNQYSIQQRICMGSFASEEELEQTCSAFLDSKDIKLSAIKSAPYLSKSSKREMIKFLKSFYRIIKNPNREEIQLPVSDNQVKER
jgi:hypothetical protein